MALSNNHQDNIQILDTAGTYTTILQVVINQA